MMRWLRELFKPAEKCARVGHKETKVTRRTWRKPDYSSYWEGRYVAVKCEETRRECSRCKQPLGDWDIERGEGFTGYSWPASKAERFDRDGFVLR